ncbi:glucose sorbosone dehydrogenase [Haladaptatus paucihalophilus DX253]|uniref:Glucose sorbosone dehydrogenase n=1 Tax=Haladaptatus paucihalophilus DX253 TaxID=797209 RepID=E7QP60_HALPU|nr:PQQ-dependent sugar dehydrogenase [Haladaptatus paucihalophilus]EFW93976.1 glucose sorbosone dehydrogenase [Haladaptatus paucihalophilus DX253]SHK65345.1 Glucose/arabinose dehydrogenase, beta-propeller fold [Haladaptatus paucihalophilus DX253]
MRRRTYLQSMALGITGLAGCIDSPGRSTGATTTNGERGVRVKTVAMNLEVPWGAAFSSNGDLYFTERPGRIRRIRDNDHKIIADMTNRIAHAGEGGLLGLAFHPKNENLAYTYQTYESGGTLQNRVVRHRVSDGFERETVVLDGIPAASNHDGGRLLIHDDALFVTTGDASDRQRAQDVDSLAGKVLRLTLDGRPHPENPFDNEVFTYGHRNPQGLAFDEGTLYSTEHGRDVNDEINVLEAGNNYGWPDVTGKSDEYANPIATYTPTIAPGGATFYDGPISQWKGDFFFGSLVDTHLHRVRIDGRNVVEQERLLDGEYGRLRTTFTGPNGDLYVMTSNQDGRASNPAPQDDRILKLQPA